MRDDALGRALVEMARYAIGAELGTRDLVDGENAQLQHDALAAPGATFVTLFSHETLRGCIGTLEARRPLGVDVRANAVAAAFSDPRFPPLRRDEFPDTRVEVSLLSAPESISCGERALAARSAPARCRRLGARVCGPSRDLPSAGLGIASRSG